MSKGPSHFRVTDAKRLTQALTSAGAKIVRVELDGGKVVMHLADGSKAAEPADDLDRWIADKATDARPS